LPWLADRFVGGEALEGSEPSAGIVGGDEAAVRSHLRRADDGIVVGTLRAGARFDEQQLAFSGLAKMRPRRGGVVTRLTPERIRDMVEAMAAIEAMCVRLATNRMMPLERSRLIQLHDSSLAMATRK
jgi:DNA-binding GntR family transcriptional regulator